MPSVATGELIGGRAAGIASGSGYRLDRDGVHFARGVLGDLASVNFVAGASGSGWRLRANGSAEIDAAAIRGTITADHISADVRNWQILNNTSGTVPSRSGTLSRISSEALNNFDTIVCLISGSDNIGRLYGFVSIPRSVIPNDTTPNTVQGSLAGQQLTRVHCFFGRSGNTLYFASHQNDLVGFTFHEAWGIRQP